MLIQRKMIFLVLIFLSGLFALQGQSKRLISGMVIDAATKEPLPYVTISLKKLMIGVVTNEEGKFDLYVPAALQGDTLLVNYLGYKHFLIETNAIKDPFVIPLEATVVQLEEIVIRPLSPENYIQMAMRRIKENYPKDPFMTEAYYREKVLENKNLINCNEGMFRTYYPNYLDTVKNQNQLLLFRKADNPQEVAFMSRKKKKEDPEDTLKKNDLKINIGESFGGPSGILKSGDISKVPEDFLDSTEFKNYKYAFAKSSSYNTGELIVIDFASKGKVNHKREKGRIYIDLNSMAIVKIECDGDFVIPAVVKPIFFLLSIGVKNPTYEKRSEFQQINGKWYPKNIRIDIHVKLTNNHLFRPDERSLFDIEQFFTVNRLKTESVAEIPEEKRFKGGKEMEKQVFNDDGLTWEGLNIIKK